MSRGIVKTWLEPRGFGFITQDGALRGDPDLFCHRTGVLPEHAHKIQQGDRVDFDVITAEKGPKAVNVRVIN